ncbi:FAD-binding and (Fe-S)-binding domain-containing protein [Saccharopolyspora shandongensis]|uniref:FAD-binding and (Fe-S)-binding domain-containing protein n=1 Tax=Saccharopolyspora shandongensis TaxID=418495 RepID=UPI0033D9BB40
METGIRSHGPHGERAAADLAVRLSSALPEATRTDLATRAAYTSDASIYRQLPAAILHPRNADDVRRAVRIAADLDTPVTARGGGTSVAGNAIGPGLVVDFSRHMKRIISIDPDQCTAVVEPGVVLDELRAAAQPYGLTFGPDPSTHSRCTLGGMIGNNACGSHSVAWGTTADNVERLQMLLPDGRELDLARGTSGDEQVDARLTRLRDDNLALLRTELGRFPRQISGYGLSHLLPEKGFDVAKALVGSEATCGVALAATVRLIRPPRARVLLVLGFHDVYEAAACAPLLAKAGALTVEGMDEDLLAALRARPGKANAGAELPPGRAWLYCEVGGATRQEATMAAHALADLAADSSRAVITDASQTRALWRIREEGAGTATRLVDGGEAWPGWEDSAVPPEHLASYLRDLHELLREYGRRGVVYGHFGEGCVHVRSDWDLTTEAGLRGYREIITAAADLVVHYGGSLSGEHGDGRARSELLSRMYSPAVLSAFAGFKAVFDPGNLLNPGLIVDPKKLDEDVRPGPGHDLLSLTPVHALHQDGGSLASALRRCVGVGKCRQTTGPMCPSFQATRDELHSTRGRARALAEMLRGESLPDGWRSTEVRDALDLCLSCKACRSECPANVDMATYKAEFLHHHYARRLRPLSHYSMGWLPVWSRFASAAPRLVNGVTSVPTAAKLLKKLGGIEPRRDIPRFAEESFVEWFAHRKRARGRTSESSAPSVVLWPDTFTNYLAPQVGQAAVEVLEALGYQVLLPEATVCCGLTWHSTGQLGMAKRVLQSSIRALRTSLSAGHPVVGLEPSCTVMLRNESIELLPDLPEARQLSENTLTLAEFVAHRDHWPFRRLDASAIVQPHCHQEATSGFDADQAVLERLGLAADMVSSGCCGLAGNFGFEQGHWEVSQSCAERELYPKVRNAQPEQFIVADGFSCRTQIDQGTRRQGMHLAELLRAALVTDPAT